MAPDFLKTFGVDGCISIFSVAIGFGGLTSNLLYKDGLESSDAVKVKSFVGASLK